MKSEIQAGGLPLPVPPLLAIATGEAFIEEVTLPAGQKEAAVSRYGK
jgi:hypothetical protein